MQETPEMEWAVGSLASRAPEQQQQHPRVGRGHQVVEKLYVRPPNSTSSLTWGSACTAQHEHEPRSVSAGLLADVAHPPRPATQQ